MHVSVLQGLVLNKFCVYIGFIWSERVMASDRRPFAILKDINCCAP